MTLTAPLKPDSPVLVGGPGWTVGGAAGTGSVTATVSSTGVLEVVLVGAALLIGAALLVGGALWLVGTDEAIVVFEAEPTVELVCSRGSEDEEQADKVSAAATSSVIRQLLVRRSLTPPRWHGEPPIGQPGRPAVHPIHHRHRYTR